MKHWEPQPHHDFVEYSSVRPADVVEASSGVAHSSRPTSQDHVRREKQPQMASQPRFERRRTWHSWWFREIIAVVASFLFQGAAIIILIFMSEKPLARWTFFIGLNATIAIFSTATKATLLLAVAACISQWKWLHFKGKRRPVRDFDVYDEASRGSLGSLLFLGHFRWNMGTLGSVITILALAFEPFTQQVITLNTRGNQDPICRPHLPSLQTT